MWNTYNATKWYNETIICKLFWSIFSSCKTLCYTSVVSVCVCDNDSGIYLQNNLHELWSLLNFLLPEIFSSSETFDEWFQISGENDEQEVVQQLHKVCACFSSFFFLVNWSLLDEIITDSNAEERVRTVCRLPKMYLSLTEI